MAAARSAGKQETRRPPVSTDWRTLSLLLGVLIGYTSINLLLRDVAGRVPATVVAMWRLAPLFLYAAAMSAQPKEREVLRNALRSGARNWKAVVGLVAGGVSSYVVGNTVFQHALALGGVGIASPASQGGVIWTALIVGALWFRETPGRHRIVGTLAMVAGIGLISWQHGLSVGSTAVVGALVGAAAGACWALSSVMLRNAYNYGFTPTSAQLINSGAGFLILLVISISNVGWGGLVPEGNYIIPMLLAGVLNAATLTFVALAVQRTEVVVVNMFSAGSMALSTLGGVWLFGEPWSVTVALGLLFTVGGLIYAQRTPSR